MQSRYESQTLDIFALQFCYFISPFSFLLKWNVWHPIFASKITALTLYGNIFWLWNVIRKVIAVLAEKLIASLFLHNSWLILPHKFSTLPAQFIWQNFSKPSFYLNMDRKKWIYSSKWYAIEKKSNWNFVTRWKFIYHSRQLDHETFQCVSFFVGTHSIRTHDIEKEMNSNLI